IQMDNQVPPRKVPNFCSIRYGIAIFLLFCNVIIMSQRVCMSLTMIAMVNSTEPHGSSNISTKELQDNIKNPVYNWSPEIQGIMLSSIFYGVIGSQIPAGYLSGMYSLKKLIGFALFFSSLFTLFIPPAAEFGETLVIVCRVFTGLFQGITLTVQQVIWIRWAPLLEQGRLTSLSLSGLLLGPCVVLLMTGFICDSLGWPMVFYIFGALGCALTLLWFILYYEYPKDHPFISISEKEYIMSSLVQQNGLLSSFPHLFAWIFAVVAGHVADVFQSKNILSLLTIRKLFTFLGLILPSVFSLSLLYLSSSFYGTMIFLTLASATGSFTMGGVLMNVLDIAPRYYGFLRGLTNVIGLAGGLISSTLTGMMLSQDSESSWFQIFSLMAAISVASQILYIIFAKAEVQDWAKEIENTHL
uniref:Solute carrier family 17 member 1 n=1 Tax=Catagonus wagneri TaxID=51154 RepID=A0A8C3W6X0_9CETA